jgi:hypothetical protein
MSYVPPPPSPNVTHYPRRAAAWATTLLEPALLQAVPALAEYPKAAGRVAWATTQAIIHARGRDDPGPLAMSAVIGPDLLTGLLPDEDIALLRAIELDIAAAPDAAVLVQRLERLRQAGQHLPRHFITG